MKKSILTLGVTLFFIVIILAGCQSANPQPSSNAKSGAPSSASTLSLTELPTPESGKALIAGWVVQKQDGKPYGNGGLNLAQVYRSTEVPNDGAFVLDAAHSPSAITNPDGTFIFNDIKAGEYVLVVGSPDGKNEVYVDPSTNKPKVWLVEAGQVLNTGEIKTDMSPLQ